MSNQTVGSVYQQIIREVVETSRVDFEEGGVDESVLDELARVSLLLFVFQNTTIPLSTILRSINREPHNMRSYCRHGGGVEVICFCGVGPLTQPGRSWRAWESESGRDPSVYGRFYADGTTCPRFD